MALSANTALVYRNDRGLKLGYETVKTGKTIYKNALLSLRGAGTSCEPATDDGGTAIGFLGIAKAYAQATETVGYYYDYEVKIPFKTGQITAGSRLAPAFCYDDEKVTCYPTVGPRCGVIMDYVTSYVWLWVRGASMLDVLGDTVPMP